MIIPQIHVAPMMGWTDRHFRYLLRLICPSAALYTEMITTGALVYGRCMRQLDFDDARGPSIAQLGGSDPKDLQQCTEWVAHKGYHGVNLNVGCPSPRVQAGNMGAALFKDSDRVAACVDAMCRSGCQSNVVQGLMMLTISRIL